MSHHDAIHKIRNALETRQSRLDLTSMNLTSVPPDISELIHLETLDLSGNLLQNLPEELLKLPRLKRLFLTKNRFTVWPDVLGRLPCLEMLSLKSNQISCIPEADYLSSTIIWLILTDNKIASLPKNFGFVLSGLRKLALSGNRIQKLPDSFSHLQELELLRLSNNCLDRVPTELFKLSKLTWLALGGNPYCEKSTTRKNAVEALEKMHLDYSGFTLENVLGSGASGVVYKTTRINYPEFQYAVKVFNDVSSDGRPEDELAVSAAAASGPDLPSGLIPFLGWFDRPNFGLVMDFLENSVSLGNPPSLESVTRDVYPENFFLSRVQLISILHTMAGVQAHLAERKIVHGDFYAHNILITGDGLSWLGDWGASFFYEEGEEAFEKIEVRSFGCLMEELLKRTVYEGDVKLLELVRKCLLPIPQDRPDFIYIRKELEKANV